MKELDKRDVHVVGGGLEPRQYEDQLAPEPTPSDPLVVIDYNPPQQPQ